MKDNPVYWEELRMAERHREGPGWRDPGRRQAEFAAMADADLSPWTKLLLEREGCTLEELRRRLADGFRG